MDDIEQKYRIMAAAFIGAIMVQTGCTKEEAMDRVANLCAKAEEFLVLQPPAPLQRR